MLGSSEESAGLAAKLGLPYSFAYFINNNVDHSLFSRYRARFMAEPGNSGSTPYASLGVFVICADTEAEALRLARSRELWFCNISGGDSTKSFIPSVESAEAYTYTAQQQAIVENTRSKMVLGTPEQVKSSLTRLAEQFGADELVVLTITYDFEARCRSYELLAEAWSLGAIRL